MEDVTRIGNDDAQTVLTRPRVQGAPLLSPDEVFGSYRIVRLLGRGGMGEVYEGEHQEHGRRVALKILTTGFAGPEDRERFLREGELAASINHPHTVYVYGSEEIEGAPVITMELLSGGTLRDVVQTGGPLQSREAVDRILDVIAGLEAAARGGILHRDIKPANCFVDANGIVKIGDFGLSLGATGTDRTATGPGLFQGTPQFAPPEQLRGDALDVRADIYAVGATLFYLLTGQPPFDDADLTTLVTRVREEAPRSAREMRAGVPDALADVVSRCLAKDRTQRPASYAVLEEQLRPFSSTAPVPASLVWRAFAGLMDGALFSFAIVPILVMFMVRGQVVTLQAGIVQSIAAILYFATLEGLWSASLGKRIAGLRVIRLDGQRPGFLRALLRACVYQTPALVSIVPTAVMGAARMNQLTSERPLAGPLIGLGALAAMALLFSPARRRNGFAAVHDRISRTRVIVKASRRAVSAVDLGVALGRQSLSDVRRLGPYDIIGSLGPTASGEVLLGRDERLKRSVWIHCQPPGTPAVAARLHAVGRPTRLRWLTGRRTATDAWDAYEALDGGALALVDWPQPWAVVRVWLHDLATEIRKGAADGTLESLSTDRVWVTASSGAKLLDFRAPRLPADVAAAPEVALAGAQPWLAAVTRRALAGAPGHVPESPGETMPLPPSATATLDRLQAGAMPAIDDVVGATAELRHRLDVVTRGRRSAAVLLSGLMPFLLATLGFVAAIGMKQLAADTPEVEPLRIALQRLYPPAGVTVPPLTDTERHALEVYAAGRYGRTLANEATWTHPLNAARLAPFRASAADLLRRHPNVTPEALETAKASLGSFLEEEQKAIRNQDRLATRALSVAPVALGLMGFGVAAAAGVILAFVFRSGLLLKMLGLAVVGADGRQVSRFRAAWRALIAWAPAGAVVVIAMNVRVFMSAATAASRPGWLAAAITCAVVFLSGAAIAMYFPNRGLQDRLAGTFVVPQ